MALKLFLIIYPDRSQKHVSAKQREQMLLAGEIRKDGDNYRFVGQARTRTFHSFAALAAISTKRAELRRFLPGVFTIESPDKQKRYTERLESPEHLALRVMANA